MKGDSAVTLHLLIDTSVWLDLAKDYRQLPLLDALTTMVLADDVQLLLPQVVLDEYGRNKDRVLAESARSLSSHFKLVREAIVRLAPEEERAPVLAQLNDVDHRIAVAGEAANEAIELIGTVFASTPPIETTDSMKARAADRAISKTAPFHRQRNGIDDAILIECYVDALEARKDPEDVFAFVTHNTHDFSDRAGDTRLPHLDLAYLFNGTTSRYATSLGPLLGEFAEDLLEEVRFEREYSQEPRRLSELLDAEHKLAQQVWYNRKWNLIARLERGDHRLVTQEAWDKADPQERQRMTIYSVWYGMLASMKRVEEELGPDGIGPWTDFEWGMVNGKLSAIRWVLGDDWDLLDT